MKRQRTRMVNMLKGWIDCDSMFFFVLPTFLHGFSSRIVDL